MYWTVEVCIPLNDPELKNSTNITEVLTIGQDLEKKLGRQCNGSGAGLGFRDMSWDFDNKQDAGVFYCKVFGYKDELPVGTQINKGSFED